ncbi:hypothetical protein ACHAPU_009092 [Fusarium lateritium]
MDLLSSTLSKSAKSQRAKLQSLSGNMFLFLDGMDEHGGRHQDLVSLIQQLERLPKVKICASSRPWLVFEDAFKMGASLMLQDLTYSDILRFVNDKLASNDRFAQLRHREAQFASTLEMDIASKSDGVFLWVHLVVESLLDGLRNSDRISDLKKRLETIPPDLDGFYNSILNGSDNFYFEHAAQLIRILRTAEGSINLLDFAFADEEDPDAALKAPIQALSHEERVYRCEAIRRRINSRTKGLLDIPLLKDPDANQTQLQLTSSMGIRHGQSPSTRGDRGALDSYQDYSAIELTWLKVEYLHRTVKDFLANLTYGADSFRDHRLHSTPVLHWQGHAFCGSRITLRIRSLVLSTICGAFHSVARAI